jgi:hypothetical protein
MRRLLELVAVIALLNVVGLQALADGPALSASAFQHRFLPLKVGREYASKRPTNLPPAKWRAPRTTLDAFASTTAIASLPVRSFGKDVKYESVHV